MRNIANVLTVLQQQVCGRGMIIVQLHLVICLGGGMLTSDIKNRVATGMFWSDRHGFPIKHIQTRLATLDATEKLL